MTIEIVSLNRSHDGMQGVYKHDSRETGTSMTFSVYVPPHQGDAKLPAAGAYDFGLGAGFYVDATRSPFSRNYRMWSYVTKELPELIGARFPVDLERQSILGHSMGGHGALTIALSYPRSYRAASAFSPIAAPSQVPWDIKALTGYLGDNMNAWRKHDTVLLIEDGARFSDFLVDVGDSDPFLAEQLRPELLERACAEAGIALTLRRQAGYDHSYYFVSTFMADHLRWHAMRLRA
jgi:S-formylglutathione hydrolase